MAFGLNAVAQNPAAKGVILSLNGPVTPPIAQYLEREISAASDAGAELIVLEIDTPGGLVDSMKTINKAILASNTPVATFVSPQGARSASAGLYIMYAAHVSAMAPYTNTGAATPVSVGGDQPTDERPKPDTNNEETGDQDAADKDSGAPDNDNEAADETTDAPLGNSDALRAKAINDSVAYIRSLAEERGRNADWAESAVRDAASVTAREALELGVIDLIADDVDDLLAKIDGREVTTIEGQKTLDTKNLALERVEPTFVETILGFIANPNVAVILMSLATTGIVIEMWNPGSIFPGTIGALCLLFGLYAFQVLPFNWLPLMIMALGILLIVVEAYTPVFGLSGITGLGLFAAGAYFLFPPALRVSPSVIIAMVSIVGGLLGLVLIALIGSRSHGPMIGSEAIRKREGYVDDWNGNEGWVIVEGERWRARADKPLSPGDKIRVVEVDGLVLVVKQARATATSLLSAINPREGAA